MPGTATITFANDAHCRGVGMTKEDLLDRSILDFAPAADRERLSAYLASLAAEPRPGGYVRIRLVAGTAAETARFAAGLETLLTPAANPRYLLSRPVARADDSRLAPIGRLLRRKPPLQTWDAWHAVPDDLGNRKERAQVLERHWRLWVAPRGRLVFTTRSDEGRAALIEAQSQDSEWQAQLRTLWD